LPMLYILTILKLLRTKEYLNYSLKQKLAKIALKEL